jgi:multidrug resistance protein MdtO
MNLSALFDLLRRELRPTPGRGAAALRLTLACVAATIPIMTHHIPHGLVVMIVMYLITREDTSTTLLGSILGLMGATIGLGAGLLAWEISMDVAWLRLCFFAAFLFAGLFLKRIISIPGLGSAIGLPAALAMVLPDILTTTKGTASPKFMVDFVLWMWDCVFVGLAVNLGVQFLLWPGDPLMLLDRQLDTRFRVAEETLRRMAGSEPQGRETAPPPSLASLATAGMSVPLELLKTASLTHVRARQRHDELAAMITLIDRLVADAWALQTVTPTAADGKELVRVADACARCRRMLSDREGAHDEKVPMPDRVLKNPLLADMERIVQEIALVARVKTEPGRPKEARLRLLAPDAFSNPEYLRFAIKGALSAFICYLFLVGFDYRGIYTSVITCFVVSLTTIGSSNQKGVLRFSGAAVGGLMGMVALIYLFPNVDTIGGFWLVFGAGTALAAWVNFGTPRLSYAGYQTGLAFYKTTLHDFGPSRNLTVFRDRMVGVALGLTVFGLVEHFLWPVRASDRMRERMGDVLKSLAGLALLSMRRQTVDATDVEERRRLISQQMEDLQGFIESSKFEPGADSPEATQRLLSGAQTLFLVLLAIARHRLTVPDRPVLKETLRLGEGIAAVIERVADKIRGRELPAPLEIDEHMAAVEAAISARAAQDARAEEKYRTELSIYRELVAAVKRLATIAL